MTSFQLKLTAIVLMTIDHAGLLFFPDLVVFRLIGRLAFPVFAWQLALGALHTSNARKFMVRLVVFGIISQPIFWWFLTLAGADPWSLNIFFTLALGLAAIVLGRRYSRPWQWILMLAIVLAISYTLPFDYGPAGVMSIVAFYVTRRDWRLMLLGQAIIFWLYSAWLWWQSWSYGLSPSVMSQPVAPLAAFLVALYNGQQGHRAKYLFYLFYPLHLLILGLVFIYLS